MRGFILLKQNFMEKQRIPKADPEGDLKLPQLSAKLLIFQELNAWLSHTHCLKSLTEKGKRTRQAYREAKDEGYHSSMASAKNRVARVAN